MAGRAVLPLVLHFAVLVPDVAEPDKQDAGLSEARSCAAQAFAAVAQSELRGVVIVASAVEAELVWSKLPVPNSAVLLEPRPLELPELPVLLRLAQS